MSRITNGFALPLLSKDLIEQSARKGTYIRRVLYALALYGTVLWTCHQQLGLWNGPRLGALGQGRTVYLLVAWLQFSGIYLFLPAMTCGVLTSEKERDTLGLLLLTKLGPWTIILEKLFSRLFPMATFLLLSLPLLTIAYSLGGVELNDIAKLMWVLAVASFQVASFAVLCSAWFRTTAGAFLATYILGAAAIFATAVLLLFANFSGLLSVFQLLLSVPAYGWLVSGDIPNLDELAFAPSILNGGELLRSESIADPVLREQTILDCLVMSVPVFSTSILSLIAARAILWRRAFVQPRNAMLKLFRLLDAFFQRANHNRLTRGIVFGRESVDLPKYEPISWRETSKRSLGKRRYLLRMLLLLEIPVVITIQMPVSTHQIRSGIAPQDLTEWCLWSMAVLVIAIQSTGLIGLERSRQTLDVLLTTPVESKEIIRQKFAGVWRLIIMLWIPFATVYIYQFFSANFIEIRSRANHPTFGDFHAILAVGIYLPTIAWFGFYLGLRCRSQTQAILATLTILITICAFPLLITGFMRTQIWLRVGPAWMHDWMSGFSELSYYFSPAAILFWGPQNEQGATHVLAHFVVVTGVWLCLKYISEREFAQRVGRNDGIVVSDEELDPPIAELTFDERIARIRRGPIAGRRWDGQ